MQYTLFDAIFSISADGLLPRGVYVIFCRFLPRNNNLIICALSNGVLQVLNISTGKFNHDCHGAPMLGKTLAVTLNATGSVLWAGNDRGYIESFRIDSTTGKLQVINCAQPREHNNVLKIQLAKLKYTPL